MTRHGVKGGVSALAIGLLFAGAAGAEGPAGLWKTEVKEDGRYLHVQVAPCDAAAADGSLCGTAVGAFGGAQTSTVGKRIFWDMKPEGEGEWTDGQVWAPDDDKTYDARMELKSPTVLELSGCVLGGLICRGQDWTRVE